MLSVNKDICNSCGLCEKTCPFGAITVADACAVPNENCTLCGACVNVCPVGALSIARKRPSSEKMAEYAGVLVWGECEKLPGDRLAPKKVVYELLSQARCLADKLGETVTVIVLGDDRLVGVKTLGAHGADRVLRCRHPLLDRYTIDGFANVICSAIAGEKPSVFLLGATPNGRELAPRIAARMDLGLTADCTQLDIDDQRQMVQTRPAFGGNIMASIISPYTRPQMATVRPNVFPAAEFGSVSKAFRVDDMAVTLSKAAIRTKIVEEMPLCEASVNIEAAQVIVAAGRGCQNKENLGLIQALAKALGGVMAGSRAIVEMDWIPHTLQVGQSGTTVSPQLYIAVGISGAIQHVVGMSTAKTIVAINCDPEAPIFKVVDLGIVGDALQILPGLTQAIRDAAVKAAKP